MDKNVSWDSHALNSPISYSVLNPKLDHVFGLMENVIIITDVKMQWKRHILNAKHFHHYVQPMEIHASLLRLVKTHH